MNASFWHHDNAEWLKSFCQNWQNPNKFSLSVDPVPQSLCLTVITVICNFPVILKILMNCSMMCDELCRTELNSFGLFLPWQIRILLFWVSVYDNFSANLMLDLGGVYIWRKKRSSMNWNEFGDLVFFLIQRLTKI